MKVLELPFNKFIGLQKSDKENYLLTLENKPEYNNHLGTIHASVMFALSEATSGQFLLNQFNGLKLGIIPMVRKGEVKYSKPGQSTLHSNAGFLNQTVEEIIEDLVEKGKVIIKVKVNIFNELEEKLMTTVFDWFVSAIK